MARVNQKVQNSENKKAIKCFIGIVLLGSSIFSILSFISYDWHDIARLHAPPNNPTANVIGPIGAYSTYFLLHIIGFASFLIPLWLLIFGIRMTFFPSKRVTSHFLWCMSLTLSVSLLIEWNRDIWTDLLQYFNLADPGGVVQYYFVDGLLVKYLSVVGSGILLFLFLVISLIMFVGYRNILTLFKFFGRAIMWLFDHSIKVIERIGSDKPYEFVDDQPEPISSRTPRIKRTIRPQNVERIRPIDNNSITRPATVVKPPEEKKKLKPMPELFNNKNKKVDKKADKKEEELFTPKSMNSSSAGNYVLPPMSILQQIPASATDPVKVDTNLTSQIIEETLSEFNIPVEVTHADVGPVVTNYEMIPARGVKLQRIGDLSNNLKMALSATSIRILAPIPGRNVVGIEVPNPNSKMVFLRQLLEGDALSKKRIHLPLFLGKDVSGKDLVADLADMPHLLIAGATGAGKSVSLNSILTGLLMTRRPEELRLILVDPKRVEFTEYNHLPHLVVPVITDPKKVAVGLRWAINEMDKRYKMFQKAKVKNIVGFNTRNVEIQPELFELDEPAKPKSGDDLPEKLPYITIIIDEIADIMMVDGNEVENAIARLAQLSRAVGIHMILATQRPSVNVITGTIKANIPGRIAFQVAQKNDSRTILDASGADALIGKGDMLFLNPRSKNLVRAQGAFSPDEDIATVTAFIREQAKPEYDTGMKAEIDKPIPEDGKKSGSAPSSSGGGSSVLSDEIDMSDDPLIEKALDIIRETRRASTSSLQRRLRIGYTRAGRIIDTLQDKGIVGPPKGSEPREILVDLDGDIPTNDSELPEDDDSETDDDIMETDLEDNDFDNDDLV
ncbi:MAG: DNA translocase FtsK 4TM domain-containing protein [Kiritimatiellae bacterium]|jgi:S-DNA-T family DNA segregation ATPase FtsK/SpoIIIE|nr:DNA translocase FtsK 4TM domain-containing protein [Kiritimatiellia bacterium]